jgi:hypothetical protein
VTDKLKSYAAAKRVILPSVEHRQSRYLNNRAEVSHQPTRRRERQMKRFKSGRHAQRFLSSHSQIHNHFQLRRHHISANQHRAARDAAFRDGLTSPELRLPCKPRVAVLWPSMSAYWQPDNAAMYKPCHLIGLEPLTPRSWWPHMAGISTARLRAGSGRSSSLSGRLRSSQASQSGRSRTTIWRLWMGATSGPGSVVSSVKASAPSGIGRHRSAKQNQSPPAFVNFHFDFGDFVPVNSKKCDAGIRQRPFGKRRPSERKLMTGVRFGRAGGKPQRSRRSSTPPAAFRSTIPALCCLEA